MVVLAAGSGRRFRGRCPLRAPFRVVLAGRWRHIPRCPARRVSQVVGDVTWPIWFAGARIGDLNPHAAEG